MGFNFFRVSMKCARVYSFPTCRARENNPMSRNLLVQLVINFYNLEYLNDKFWNYHVYNISGTTKGMNNVVSLCARCASQR